MIIFPAIDLKDGACVRLKLGDMEQVTIFNDDPAAQAKIFAKQGFPWIHIVDLNGAFAGKPVNSDSVKAIRNAVDISLQLGGGIRDLATIEHWLGLGINRVILGTAALKDPELVKTACRQFPEQIVVGIDGKKGMVAVEGWAKTASLSVIELAKKFEDAGVAAIIYTDIGRDGILAGPDLDGTKALADAVSIPIIASGGVSSNEDLFALAKLEDHGICGAITGRALYDGRLNLEDLKKSKFFQY